jgi:hypothetical protein
MLTFYLLVAILIAMIWYAGYEGTMRVFQYIELEIKYAWVKFRMWQMKRQLEKDLNLPASNFSALIKDINNGK